jgi:hypothetical protein
LKTRNLIVDIPSENSYVVDILNEEKTAVTDAISLLKYNSNEGYSISKKQELIGSVDSTKVEVVFIKN